MSDGDPQTPNYPSIEGVYRTGKLYYTLHFETMLYFSTVECFKCTFKCFTNYLGTFGYVNAKLDITKYRRIIILRMYC